MYSQRSTIPAKFVKIGPVDVEIIGLTEITELFFKFKKTLAKHIARLRHLESGGLK